MFKLKAYIIFRRNLLLDFKRVYINKNISKDILDELSENLNGCEKFFVNSNEAMMPPGLNSTEKIDYGKTVIYFTNSNNQVKTSPACTAGFCPGFKKIVIASNGCPFSCEYCFLQATYRSLHPFIKINYNSTDLLKELEKDINSSNKPVIYNAGEMLDSLALDEYTRLTKILVPFFAKKNDAYLLLLTKSNNVQGLLNVKHNGRTIVSWSINCDYITNRYEHGTSTLDERIVAASQCSKWGYPIRFRFDPIIIHKNWESNYRDMVKKVLGAVKPQRITLGSLRFAPPVKGISKKRFPDSEIFNHTFTKPLEDKKCRYIYEERLMLYSFLLQEIRKINKTVEIGLCKEEDSIWKALGLEGKGEICNCIL